MELVELYRYPVKSLAGSSLQRVALDRFGLVSDRRWMVVGRDGLFVTQREIPEMALVATAVDELGNLQLRRGSRQLGVNLPSAQAPRLDVTVWGDALPAADAGEPAAAWLSQELGLDCRLVYMPDEVARSVDPAFAEAGDTVSFADGYPLLLIGQASLDDLNQRLPAPVPMNRFRPNLVIGGAEPFAEDRWSRIRIGTVEFELVKPCSRCVIPSIVQEDASRDLTITRALAGFRRREGVIYFGQNLLHRGRGDLSVGDSVEVLA